MSGYEQRAKRYPTDLTDEEWRFIQPFLRPAPKRGRKPTTDLRAVLDALRYLARTGGGCCSARSTIHDVALMLDRERENREQSPTAAVVDSQSVKAPAAEKRGFDAGKRLSAASGTSLSTPTAGC